MPSVFANPTVAAMAGHVDGLVAGEGGGAKHDEVDLVAEAKLGLEIKGANLGSQT